MHQQTNWVPSALRHGFITPAVREVTLQWLIIILIGLGLGGYILVASSLSLTWTILLALVGLCPFVLMIVGNVRRLLLVVVIVDIPLQYDVYLNYRSEVAELGAFGGINLSITTIALIILYALWISRLLIRVEPQPRNLVRSSFPLNLYLGFILLSLISARDLTLSFFQVIFLCQNFLLYLYLANAVQTREEITFIIKILLICLAFESLIMVGVYATGQDINVAGISTKVEPGFDRRVAGTFYSPNNAAAYLSLLLVPIASVFLTNSERWLRWAAALTASVGIIALILTFSRGGWMALLLSGAILCLAAWQRGWFSPAMRVAVSMAAGSLALVFYIFVFSSVSRDDGGRLILMEIAFRMIEDYPLFGVGTNNFVLYLQEYATPDIGSAWLFTVHNMYMLVWAETGMGGLTAFIFFLTTTLYRGWQCWKWQDQLLSPLALGFAAAIIGHMAHMFFDFFNDRPNVQMLWLLAGLIFAMNNIVVQETNVSQPKMAQPKIKG